jgi:hypothetical protein
VSGTDASVGREEGTAACSAGRLVDGVGLVAGRRALELRVSPCQRVWSWAVEVRPEGMAERDPDGAEPETTEDAAGVAEGDGQEHPSQEAAG